MNHPGPAEKEQTAMLARSADTESASVSLGFRPLFFVRKVKRVEPSMMHTMNVEKVRPSGGAVFPEK